MIPVSCFVPDFTIFQAAAGGISSGMILLPVVKYELSAFENSY